MSYLDKCSGSLAMAGMLNNELRGGTGSNGIKVTWLHIIMEAKEIFRWLSTSTREHHLSLCNWVLTPLESVYSLGEDLLLLLLSG